MTSRIGFACKYLTTAINQEKELNTSATTVAWLNRQPKALAEERLHLVFSHNLNSVLKVLNKLAQLPVELRFMRLSSDLLPMYTEPTWRYLWQTDQTIKNAYSRLFFQIGDFARKHDIRLSFHPGQFVCLVSDKQDVVDRSIDEYEYHCDMVRLMGFGKKKLDFKVNVHLSGKLGLNGFDKMWSKLSPEARNCMTLENDEYQASIDDILTLKNKVGVVLDIHHHFIMTGEYFSSRDDRIKSIVESWQDVKPVFHYSQSREEYLNKWPNKLPTLDELKTNAPRSKLRSHSDFYNHKETNKWALEHLSWGDMMAESKMKNLSSKQLYEQLI